MVLLLGLVLSSNVNGSNLWSSPSTWPGGQVPQAGQEVTIPMGQTVILDVNPPALSGLRIMGTLRFAEVPLHLTTDWIMVMMGGQLQIGTESAPHMNKARITLTGPDVDVNGLGMGGKFISVMDGGVLHLHGASRDELSWSVIEGSLSPGATTMTLRDACTWKAGDKIVIAPSGVNPYEAEVLTVVAKSGNNVQFSPPLQYPHFGEVQIIGGKALDMRAEVGLLTRNILIEGDASSENSVFGGHVMIMNGGHGYVEGVEFFRMGQFGRQGRYPLHWHLTGQRYDNYSRFNSVHNSFHRGMVIHGTDGVTLEGNVIYNIRSHGYVIAEDGDEEDNVVLNNLGILIQKILRSEDYAFPNVSFVGNSSQSEFRPGVFWMKNPNQILQGNHAAGSVDGIGFFYDGVGTATGIRPDFFRDNISHSNYSYFTITVNERYPPLTRGHGLFMRTEAISGTTFDFEGLTAYKNSVSGVWLEEYGQMASGAMLSDNGSAAMLMRAALTNSTVVYQSQNTISPPAKRYGAINTIPTFGRKKDHLVDGVKFYGFPEPIFSYEDSVAGPNVSVNNVQFFSSTGPRVAFKAEPMAGAIRDEDGSLTGGQPALVFHDTYTLNVPSCVTSGVNNSITCPMDEYVFLKVYSIFGAAKPIGKVNANRIGGRQSMFYSYESPEAYEQYNYLPRNSRYQLNFVAPPMGLLPSLINLEAKGSATGYVGMMIKLDAGYGGYLLDEYDEFVEKVNSLQQLQTDRTNYYLDAAKNTIYVNLRLDAANNFSQKVKLLQVAATAFLRQEETESSPISAVPMPSVSDRETNFSIYLPEAGDALLSLFDITGRRVRNWDPGTMEAGQHNYRMDLSDLPSGTYVYRLEAASGSTSGKLSVIR